MIKKSITACLIYSLLILAVSSTKLSAQTQNKITNEIPVISEKEITQKPEINVKKVFTKEFASRNFDLEKAEVNFDKIEKDQYKQPQKKKGMSKNEKTFLIVFIAALAVGTILLFKYVKLPKCSEVDCNPDFDESCVCEN